MFANVGVGAAYFGWGADFVDIHLGCSRGGLQSELCKWFDKVVISADLGINTTSLGLVARYLRWEVCAPKDVMENENGDRQNWREEVLPLLEYEISLNEER